MLDRETLRELDAPHGKIENPFSVGLRLSGIAVLVFAVAAAARLARAYLSGFDLDWTWIRAITTVIVASSLAYAYQVRGMADGSRGAASARFSRSCWSLACTP